MIREALWDVDGTLVDTAAEHFRAWQKVARELNRTFSEADFARTFGWRNSEILRDWLSPDLDDATCTRLGDRKETLYRERVREQGVDLLPGVGPMLSELRASGIRQVVGSSAPRENVELLLQAARIRHYFDALVTGDDVPRGKPAPDVFLQGMQTEPKACVVFEDAVAGIQAAKAAHMWCVAIRFVGHHSEERLREAGADLIVPSLSEWTWPELSLALQRLAESRP